MNLKRNITFLCFIAFVCAALGNDQNSTPPHIIDQPEEDLILFQVSSKNMTISIPCQAEGAPPLKYTWKKKGKTLPDYNSKDINGTLLITNLTKDNVGEYQCFVSNELGTARSNSVFLREFDYFNNTSNNVTEGDSFSLVCNFTVDLMNKEQNYWIRKQNDTFEKIRVEEDARMTMDPNGTLWISRLETNDSGSYKYRVPMQKNLSHDACQIELNVKPSNKPKANFTFQRKYVSNETEYAENNKSKKLYCIYDGSPSLKTVWKMNGIVLLNDSSNIVLGKSEKYLEIKNFQPQIQNVYSCEVTDNVGKPSEPNKTHRFNVTIGKPYFTQEPRDMQILENGTVQFACKYAGAEDVKVEWSYNGIPIHKATFYKKLYFSDFKDCTFTINNASKNHTGNYGFKIFNKFGSVYKDVYLVERAEPNTITTSPKISTTEEASTQSTKIPDSDPDNNTTDKSTESSKSTDGVETGKVVTIVLVIASIILSIIVIFLIVMKCKTDPRYGEYELATREANNGVTSDLNPSQMQAESSNDDSNSNNTGTKKHRARPTRNNNATAK